MSHLNDGLESIQDDDLRRYLLEIARSMKAHSEMLLVMANQ